MALASRHLRLATLQQQLVHVHARIARLQQDAILTVLLEEAEQEQQRAPTTKKKVVGPNLDIEKMPVWAVQYSYKRAWSG